VSSSLLSEKAGKETLRWAPETSLNILEGPASGLGHADGEDTDCEEGEAAEEEVGAKGGGVE
jgi:hypothetical protein